MNHTLNYFGRRLLFLAILNLGLLPPARADSDTARTPRVALMDFISTDNSFRNERAARDLTGGLHAGLAADTGFTWVERGQLRDAEQEFQLISAGLALADSPVPAGQEVSAVFSH